MKTCPEYTNRDTYDLIARKLAETMRNRRQFIHNFIRPIEESLKKQDFDLKYKAVPSLFVPFGIKCRKKY